MTEQGQPVERDAAEVAREQHALIGAMLAELRPISPAEARWMTDQQNTFGLQQHLMRACILLAHADGAVPLEKAAAMLGIGVLPPVSDVYVRAARAALVKWNELHPETK